MVTKDEAKRFLSNCGDDRCFWVHDGGPLHNLEELEGALHSMSHEAFKHHVNKEKNDFSSWIAEVIGDKALANDLASSRNKESLAKKVKNRLNVLKRRAG